MKLFKNIKRKVGNAILPVVGSILGLTILAGTVVAVALNSSKIVYRQSRLEQQNDARQILYIAAKYFCSEINNGKSDSQIRQELQEIFGPGLKITKDTVNTEKYYIWYPNKFVNSNQKEFDPNQGNDQVKEWLKATIVKTEQSDDEGDHGNTGINNTLFSQEAKLDEKFAVGNMMTVYLTDEHLLPGRKYSINEVSLVESDIDTFDEAFTYMNNSGVLEIDDIAVALYKYGVISGSNVSYIKADKDNDYEIVYKTGNLGGNYYWSNNGTSTETWLYRQEYDIDLLYEMICYQSSANKSIKVSDLKYYYDETNDSHKIYSTPDDYELVYSSSREFAEDLADYIFWKNMPRLCMYLSDFQTVIQNDVRAKWQAKYSSYYNAGYPLYFSDLTNMNWYEWKDEGLTIYPSWPQGRSIFGGWSSSRYYTEFDYTFDQIVSLFETNNTLKSKYCGTDNKLSRTKLYNELSKNVKSTMLSNNAEAVQTTFESVVKSKYVTYSSSSKSNDYILREGPKGNRTYYYWKDDSWSSNVINVQGDKNHVLHKAVEEFLLNQLTIKYITGSATREPESFKWGDIQGTIDHIDFTGLQDFQWNNDNGNMKVYYRVGYYVQRANGQIDYCAPMSDEVGDTFYFKKDGVYMGTTKIISYSDAGSAKEVFVKTFIQAFATMCNITADNLYSAEEIERKTKNQIMSNLVIPIRYAYMPDYANVAGTLTKGTMNSIIGTDSTSSYGLREQSAANKLLTFYLQHNESDLKTAIADKKYDVKITKIEYKDNLSSQYDGYLNMVISFSVYVYGTGSTPTEHKRTVSFIIKYMTYSAQNNAIYNTTTRTYTNVLNGNYDTDTDEDGNVKHVFRPVAIQNSDGNALSTSDVSTNISSILSNIPYTERIKSNQVPYGDHKITIDGVDYTPVDDINLLKNVTSNMLYDGDIEALPETDFKIKVADGKSLFINGRLNLVDDQQVELGKNSLLFVNGCLLVEYRLTQEMYYDYYEGAYLTRQLRLEDYNYFKAHGVNIYADVDAKIMVNGNFDYRGVKGKYAESNYGFNVWNSETGRYNYVDLDTIYEQYVFNSNFKDRDGNVLGACEKKNGVWDHYTYECRCALEGIYIVNGDIRFHAWDENNLTSNASNQTLAIYRNLYSNPIINGTFYVDGVFDMQGLYTSGLYDQCRANFVFAKSIVEPAIALNTVLCQGSQTQYGAWKDNDGNWSHSQGYLFMICEEAIDFSKVNFGCVNLFTPFMELVNAINANKESSTNFSDYIDKPAFMAMYPNKAVIDEWGLPSILRSGLGQLYDPGDIGAITAEDHIYGTAV